MWRWLRDFISRAVARHAKLVVMLLGLVCVSEMAFAVNIYRIGSSDDVQPVTSSAICLAGGGSDDRWAGGWDYLLRHANGGDVVIIRIDGQPSRYEEWIYNDEGRHGFPKVNSVTTLSLTRRSDADRDDVEQFIRKAELVFFSGGDQAIYVNWFRGSKLIRAVEYVMNLKRVPVGGTSAGMAFLAGIDYAARVRSWGSMVSAEDVMKDPTAKYVDLDPTVLTAPYMDCVITETHLDTRERHGRIVGFMARAVYNRYPGITSDTVRAIASDEATATCYGEDGWAQAWGKGKVYFLKGAAPIERITPGKTLDWYAGGRAVRAYVLDGSNRQARFNLRSWDGEGGEEEYWWVNGYWDPTPFFGRTSSALDSDVDGP